MPRLLQTPFLSETYYRSRRRGQGPAWIDCGVLVKPSPEHGYRQRVITDRFVVVYLLRGHGVYVDGDGVTHRLGPGDCVPHLPGRSHSVVPDADGQWVEFFVQVPIEFARTLSELGHLHHDDRRRHPGLRKELLAGIDELMAASRAADEQDAPKLLAMAHRLLTGFYQPGPSPAIEESHHAAIEAAREALSEADAASVDLTALAEQHGLSYERLRKLFRQAVGLPPGEYRIRRRIDRARAMIAERGLSNKAIAFELGYPDPFAFSKQFKKYVGMSPSAFRKEF